jgi:hypothetical protein
MNHMCWVHTNFTTLLKHAIYKLYARDIHEWRLSVYIIIYIIMGVSINGWLIVTQTQGIYYQDCCIWGKQICLFRWQVIGSIAFLSVPSDQECVSQSNISAVNINYDMHTQFFLTVLYTQSLLLLSGIIDVLICEQIYSLCVMAMTYTCMHTSMRRVHGVSTVQFLYRLQFRVVETVFTYR